MSILHPNVSLNNVTEITEALLDGLGVTALIIDIDNTLTTHNNPDITPEIKAWLASMSHLGIKMVLASNNYRPRVENFAKVVGLDFVEEAGKPLLSGFKRAKAKLGVPLEQIAMVGDQIFTDIYGGNRFGAVTIHVDPIQTEGNLFFRLKRWAENKVLDNYYAKQGKKR